jgi:MYXO-CTERM domain-containing protein
MNKVNFVSRMRGIVITAVLGGMVLLTGGTAQAALITVDALYIQSAISVVDPSKNVTVKGIFDDSGLTGVGNEIIQLSSIEFRFSKRFGLVQTPIIVPTAPDSSGRYPQGTFLAEYIGGVFKSLVSSDRGGGFASAPARIFPSPSVPNYVALTRFQLIERVGFSGPIKFNFKSQTLTVADSPVIGVPAPPALWLFAIGLAGYGFLRRRHS